MKKHILALLFLLFALIVTCVYQHTYILYAEAHAEDNTSTQKIVTIKSSKENEVATKEPAMLEKSALDESAVEESAKIIDEEKPKEKASTSLIEKITNAVISATSSEKKETVQTSEKITDTEATTDNTLATVNTQKEEKEVIDYLLTVMNERGEAFTNRDQAEANLHALIKKVLEDRRIAIENMHKVSLEIEQDQLKRITERDTLSQNNSQEKGK